MVSVLCASSVSAANTVNASVRLLERPDKLIRPKDADIFILIEVDNEHCEQLTETKRVIQ